MRRLVCLCLGQRDSGTRRCGVDSDTGNVLVSVEPVDVQKSGIRLTALEKYWHLRLSVKRD